MAEELSPDIVAEVVKVCQAGAEEAADALRRALGTEVQLSVAEPRTADMQALPEGLVGPGLAVVLSVGSTGALLLLPESSGLLPAWYADPDPTGRSKLATLAQELAGILLPERYAPDDFEASRVESLSEALARGSISDGAAMLPLEIQGAESTRATAHFVWPLIHPAAVLGQQPAEPEAEGQSPPKPKSAAQPEPPFSKRRPTLQDLPDYTRSLLRIKLPVVVTLARKRQPVGQILNLGPGSILQFEKSCQEMLELEVGGLPVATGEAVKVDDKFGLRINAMILPEERFRTVRKQ